MDQLPEPSALVVPSSVVPSVSYSLTVALAPEVPVSVGVVSEVTPSPKVPLSLPLDSAGTGGADGPGLPPTTIVEALKVLESVPSSPWSALTSFPPVGSEYENSMMAPAVSAGAEKVSVTVLPVPSTVTPVTEVPVPLI